MRRWTAVVTSLAFAFLSSAGTTRAADAEHVDAAGARDLLGTTAEIVVVDVRTPGEFQATHIDRQGTLNIDVDGAQFREKIAELDREGEYVVHCAAGIPGGRSERAVQVMEELGFTKVHHLDGGINAWKEAGYDVEGTAVDTPDDSD